MTKNSGPAIAPEAVAAAAAPVGSEMGTVLRSIEAQSRLLTSLAGGGSFPAELGEGDGPFPFPALSGARGAAALEAWRRALLTKPEQVTARIRANRDQALTGMAGIADASVTMRNYLSSEVPFGNAKTAAYLMFGIADVLDLMEHGQWLRAEACLCLLLASGEQAALPSWSWPIAWLVTQLPEPQWVRIRHQPAPDTARPISRLADQSLMAAVIAYYRDVATVMEAQRKASAAAPPQPPSGGHLGAGGNGADQAEKPKPGKPKVPRGPKTPAVAAAAD